MCISKTATSTSEETSLGCTPKGAYSTRGRSRHLLETPFSEPLLRTLLRTLFYCKTHIRPPSQNPSENPFPRTLPRTFSEPFSERCVAVRALRRAPYGIPPKQLFVFDSDEHFGAILYCSGATLRLIETRRRDFALG